MKDPRMRGMSLITYLDDASRRITGAALFQEATSETAVIVLRQAIGRFGIPATILSDNGSCFVGAGGRKRPKGAWTPTLFENELLSLDIGLINSRLYRPQTNGKLERFHRASRTRYDTMAAWMTTSNTTTPQAALGAGHRQLLDAADGVSHQDSHRRYNEAESQVDGGGHQWLTVKTERDIISIHYTALGLQ